MKQVFGALLLLLLATNSFSQKIWTLQESVEFALQHNIQVRQSEISAKLAEVNQSQSFYNLFPSLNGSSSYTFNSGRSVDPTSYQFTTQNIKSANASLNANVALFNGFQLQNTLKQSRLDYMASKYDFEKIKNDVSLNVAAAYLQVLYSKEQLNAANDRVDATKKQRDRSKVLVDAGTLPKGSLLDAESQLSTEEYNKVAADNALALAYLNLTQLLELDSIGNYQTENPKVDIPDQAALAQSAADIYAMAITKQPEIKSADIKLQSAEKGLAIARGSLLPRLSLFGSLSSSYSSEAQRSVGDRIFGGNLPAGTTASGEAVTSPFYYFNYEKTPFSDQIDQNFYKSVGLSLNIPIFNGFSSQNSVKRAKLNLENTKYSSELTKNQLYKSIQQAHLDAVAALNKYKAAEKSSEALRETYSYIEKKFTAGLITSLDLLTARNNLTKAESDVLQAKYDFIFRLKVLDFYQGKSLAY